MIVYTCEQCDRRVTKSPFRQTCPNCRSLLSSRGTINDFVDGL